GYSSVVVRGVSREVDLLCAQALEAVDQCRVLIRQNCPEIDQQQIALDARDDWRGHASELFFQRIGRQSFFFDRDETGWQLDAWRAAAANRGYAGDDRGAPPRHAHNLPGQRSRPHADL